MPFLYYEHTLILGGVCFFVFIDKENSVFSRFTCDIYKNEERGADDENHESAKKTIKKGISRKWIVLDKEEEEG
ncbi:hypothetical protein SLU01_10330 [Sporosarcina luteola]|uniref:Uncharacterized protein n=1 Tax=Sporosarcina luteola TaxID=582850 RepID=A0A511Z5J9_9BACL|nr:hypothetical protein SLU01_10330 [Sporosarcina luteola]